VLRHPGEPIHFSVSVVDGAESLQTHQVVFSETGSVTRIVATAEVPPGRVLASVEVPLDAQAALAKQRALMGIDNLGQYDKVTNSCVSHVSDVLQAGGVATPAAEGSAQLRFLLDLLKARGGT